MSTKTSFLVVLNLLAAPSLVAAQCGTQTIANYVTPSQLGFDRVNVVAQNFPPHLAGAVSTAIGFWNDSSCNSDTHRFPYFGSSLGDYTVNVTWANGYRADGACGVFNTSSHQITIYSHALVNGQQVPCIGQNYDAISQTIAHELGHFLGLDNAPSYCTSGQMMAAMWYDYSTGNFGHASPTPVECDTANNINTTFWETGPPDPTPWCEAYGCSPILIDLDADGFRLTGLSSPVVFDINADGEPEILSWTRPGEDDAFLVLDLNANGRVDNGSELFGNHTALADGSTATNGYDALARYDNSSEGGDSNGFIDAGDAIFNALRLWIDDNHNGRSEVSELLTLRDASVMRISLHYHESRRHDKYGNSFKFLARAWLARTNGGTEAVWTTDVFFQGR